MIERKQVIEWAGAAIIGAAAVGIYTYLTDRVSRGTDAVAAAQINSVIDDRLKTDSGKTVHQEILETKAVAQANSVKLDVLLDAVGALSE